LVGEVKDGFYKSYFSTSVHACIAWSSLIRALQFPSHTRLVSVGEEKRSIRLVPQAKDSSYEVVLDQQVQQLKISIENKE